MTFAVQAKAALKSEAAAAFASVSSQIIRRLRISKVCLTTGGGD